MIFLFLGNIRATFIPAITVPVALVAAVTVLYALDFSINLLTLLAMVLAIGLVVDDSIVVLENIYRRIEHGEHPLLASYHGSREVGFAVVATTFSIVAVFLPVGLMPGVAGQFFKNFGLTVVASVLMSLAVARMITPMIAAYFLKSAGMAEHGEASWIDRYMKILRWSLGHRRWMMGIGAAALGLTVALLIFLPKQFFPDGNTDFSRVRIEMVPGTTLERTLEIANEAAAIIEKQPEVKTALQSVREGGASMFITLHEDRARTSQQFEEDLTPLLTKIADARVTFQANGPGGGGGGSGRDVSVMLSGSDPKMLDRTAATLVEQMKTLPELRAPRISADLQRPELIITPRNDLASQLGVSTVALSQTIRVATLGDIDQNSAKFSLSDRQIPIRVMLAKESRQDLDVIRNLPVPLASGGSVPLSRVADISFGAGPTSVQRRNQNFRIFIGADFAPGIVSSNADAKINNLPIMKNLPTGVSRAPFGSQEWEQEMQRDFLVALISGTLLVFAVLVLLYHRFMSPLVNMGSLLLAPLGGLIALGLVGQPISMPVFIGILMLFGIVAKNSILLIDFAIEEMARGVPKFQAIMEAGHKRAQPIVMTTVAMTAGMVPTALSLGGDGQWRSPMGTVVIGGLIVSTLLTLLIVPAGFSLADGFEKRVGPWLRTRLLTYDPDKHGEDVAPPAATPAKPAGKTAGKDDLGGLQPAE